jgi:hypothetical protein
MRYGETSPIPPGADPSFNYLSESIWNSRVQWGAILAGAFAGFAVTLIMATIGGAIGITAGAAGIANADTTSRETAGEAAVGFGIGAGVWLLLTALAAGLVGGWVLNATGRRDRAYSSVLFGGIAWSVGVCLMLAFAVPGVGGGLSGLGAGGGTATAAAEKRSGLPAEGRRVGAAAEGQGRTAQPKVDRTMTDEEKAAALDAADKAAKAAATAAWLALGAQLIGLAATMIAAGRNRHTGARVVTEVRPRPVPTA